MNDSSLKNLSQKIREVRKAKKIKLKQMAVLSGIPLATLSRIELGTNWPSAESIIKIANALSLPPALFFDSASNSTSSVIYYRAAQKLPEGFKKKVDEIISCYSRLEDICGAEKYHSFPLDIPVYEFSSQKIETAASLARKILGINNAIVFDLINLLETFGLRIVVMPLPEKTDGFSIYSPQSKSIQFFINSSITVERKVFTLAHELGHVIFHQGGTKYRVFQPMIPQEEIEKSARYFAACFLMPETAIRKTVTQLGIDDNSWSIDLLLSLKSRFAVSAEAFLTRLAELSLINKKQKETIHLEIQEYYRRSDYQEPKSTGTFLNENRRLWDLVLIGKNSPLYKRETERIQNSLLKLGVA